MQPIGILIKKRLKEQGKTVIWFSQQLACSRTNIYKIFRRSSIDTNDLLRISQILSYDFFSIYSSELREMK